jgi:hypothetical protein
MNKQYKIVEGTTPEELADKVNIMLDFGWSMEGGLVIDEGSGSKYKQTLFRIVKEGNSDNGKQLLHG